MMMINFQATVMSYVQWLVLKSTLQDNKISTVWLGSISSRFVSAVNILLVHDVAPVAIVFRIQPIALCQESMKVREVIPLIGPIPIVIPLKLFLDLLSRSGIPTRVNW